MEAPLYLGLALGLLVLVQLTVATLGMLRRTWREEALFRLKQQKLRQELAATPKKASQTVSAWKGWRTFRVNRLVRETPDTTSIYLAPEDGRPLPTFLPGQYITLSLRMPGETKPIIRCYSLSHAAGEDYYRCTVKEVPPPEDRPELPFGKASRHLNRRLAEGELIELKAPHGNFSLDVASPRPAVLIGAGIGVTPLFSMLQAVSRSGSGKQVLAFLQFRNGQQHPLKMELTALAQGRKHIQIVNVYSSPLSQNVAGRDYDLSGHVSPEMVKKYLRGSDYDFYLCGPGTFMQSMVAGLEAAGVSPDRIHFEAFGPASVKRAKAGVALAGVACPQPCVGVNSTTNTAATSPEVRFDVSGICAPWTGSVESLLDLAEAHQIPVESGCRAGNCGTCLLPIKSGKVKYSQTPGSPPAAGMCLPCICVPDGPLVLQA